MRGLLALSLLTFVALCVTKGARDPLLIDYDILNLVPDRVDTPELEKAMDQDLEQVMLTVPRPEDSPLVMLEPLTDLKNKKVEKAIVTDGEEDDVRVVKGKEAIQTVNSDPFAPTVPPKVKPPIPRICKRLKKIVARLKERHRKKILRMEKSRVTMHKLLKSGEFQSGKNVCKWVEAKYCPKCGHYSCPGDKGLVEPGSKVLDFGKRSHDGKFGELQAKCERGACLARRKYRFCGCHYFARKECSKGSAEKGKKPVVGLDIIPEVVLPNFCHKLSYKLQYNMRKIVDDKRKIKDYSKKINKLVARGQFKQGKKTCQYRKYRKCKMSTNHHHCQEHYFLCKHLTPPKKLSTDDPGSAVEDVKNMKRFHCQLKLCRVKRMIEKYFTCTRCTWHKQLQCSDGKLTAPHFKPEKKIWQQCSTSDIKLHYKLEKKLKELQEKDRKRRQKVVAKLQDKRTRGFIRRGSRSCVQTLATEAPHCRFSRKRCSTFFRKLSPCKRTTPCRYRVCLLRRKILKYTMFCTGCKPTLQLACSGKCRPCSRESACATDRVVYDKNGCPVCGKCNSRAHRCGQHWLRRYSILFSELARQRNYQRKRLETYKKKTYHFGKKECRATARRVCPRKKRGFCGCLHLKDYCKRKECSIRRRLTSPFCRCHISKKVKCGAPKADYHTQYHINVTTPHKPRKVIDTTCGPMQQDAIDDAMTKVRNALKKIHRAQIPAIRALISPGTFLTNSGRVCAKEVKMDCKYKRKACRWSTLSKACVKKVGCARHVCMAKQRAKRVNLGCFTEKACKPRRVTYCSPVCRKIKCHGNCRHGYALSPTGCPTCACRKTRPRCTRSRYQRIAILHYELKTLEAKALKATSWKLARMERADQKRGLDCEYHLMRVFRKYSKHCRPSRGSRCVRAVTILRQRLNRPYCRKRFWIRRVCKKPKLRCPSIIQSQINRYRRRHTHKATSTLRKYKKLKHLQELGYRKYRGLQCRTQPKKVCKHVKEPDCHKEKDICRKRLCLAKHQAELPNCHYVAEHRCRGCPAHIKTQLDSLRKRYRDQLAEEIKMRRNAKNAAKKLPVTKDGKTCNYVIKAKCKMLQGPRCYQTVSYPKHADGVARQRYACQRNLCKRRQKYLRAHCHYYTGLDCADIPPTTPTREPVLRPEVEQDHDDATVPADKARLFGDVFDTNHHPRSNARIECKSTDGGIKSSSKKLKTRTDANGQYSLEVPADVELECVAATFKHTAEKETIVIAAGSKMQQDFILKN